MNTFYFKPEGWNDRTSNIYKCNEKKYTNINLNVGQKVDGIVKNIYEIVSSYIMNRIYDKIYPHEPDTNDSLIHQQCVKLSWIEPHHLCKIENLNLDNILPRTVGLIKELDNEKNPEGKLKLITKVIHIILNNMTYCIGKVEGGVDDQVPMLIYIIVRLYLL